MRAVSNSLLSFLLLAALLWGNCLSCPQVLLSLTSHTPAHDCCKPTGKVPVKSQNNCQSFALQHFVKADPASQARLQPAAYAHVAVTDTQAVAPAARAIVIVVIQHSPPKLEILNSNIRI
jgi:hypothetical protein